MVPIESVSYTHLRIFDKEKDEYHIPSDAGSDTGSHPGLVEKGWVYDTTDSPSGNEDYKKRLWIYGHRIAPAICVGSGLT